MKIIRASEIGTYQFCNRAWWYQMQGRIPDNQADLAWGSEIHEKHGRQVFMGNCLQVAAYAILLVALILTTIYLLNIFL